ncbi:ROK family protein [Candidatus Enterococcus clewellii]|uniref:ROK family protein n=1 Tax=Candidatus Enterococcus clewellii TaxID=1834193 RepID=A0A242KBP5_9ENTE|nr:hypothetical protein A5888_000409 [Enterococcus sp. 9E7_DIV0242]
MDSVTINKKHLIKEENLKNMKMFLYQKEMATKAELAEAANVSVVTSNALVKELVEASIFLEGAQIQREMGRPATNYYFNYNYQHYLLLSIQEKDRVLKIMARVINSKGMSCLDQEVDFSSVDLDELAVLSKKLCETFPTIVAIGISFPGKTAGDIVTSSWYDKMNGWNFKAKISEVLSLPVYVQNDANLATIGYCLTHGISPSRLVTGIYYPEKSMPGISVFVNNHLLLGNNGLAGEAKYLPLFIDQEDTQQLDFEQYYKNLIELIILYNGFIAPHTIVVFNYGNDLLAEQIEQSLAKTKAFTRQPNRPKISVTDSFDTSVFKGIQWLAMKESIYFDALS